LYVESLPALIASAMLGPADAAGAAVLEDVVEVATDPPAADVAAGAWADGDAVPPHATSATTAAVATISTRISLRPSPSIRERSDRAARVKTVGSVDRQPHKRSLRP
jgi:hypothetical protein